MARRSCFTAAAQYEKVAIPHFPDLPRVDFYGHLFGPNGLQPMPQHLAFHAPLVGELQLLGDVSTSHFGSLVPQDLQKSIFELSVLHKHESKA